MRTQQLISFSGFALLSAGLVWTAAAPPALADDPAGSQAATTLGTQPFQMHPPMTLRLPSSPDDSSAPAQLSLLNQFLQAPLMDAIVSQVATSSVPAKPDASANVASTSSEDMPGLLSLPASATTSSSTTTTVSSDSTTSAPTTPPGPPASAQADVATSTAAALPPPPAAASPAPDATNAWKTSYINLISILAQRGILTKKDSSDLVTQAQQNAASAQAQASAALASPAAPSGSANPDDTMQVDYVPQTVKEQIRDEVKSDVMQQARDENWAAPDAVPEWVKRYHISGDFRIRYEGDFLPSANASPSNFPNFNAINTGSPYDNGINSAVANAPTYDTDQDRNRFRIRARIGAGIDLGDNFTVGLRIGTGQDDNPVTENQTIGASNNGQGGDFSKYAIWLDRGFLRYEIGGSPAWDLTATVGRMDNPFFSSSMIWANDIGFDGLAVQGKYKVANGVTPFLTAGGFPIFNTDLNFSSTSDTKFNSEDKYLFAIQGGTDWKITNDINLKTAAALYYFQNIEGKVSDPFTPLFSSDQGDTDDSRPSFAQNGNTYIALRDIVPDASNDNGLINQYQYFGLATPFHEFALTSQLDFSQLDPFHIALLGEFVKNVAFDRNAIDNNGPSQEPGPVNNRSGGSTGTYEGGDTGYNVRLQLGRPTLEEFGQWNVNLTYRYVESDAVVDGFTDADFGGPLVGTNLKGYMIGGNFALSPRVWTTMEWMSANSIAGPTYQNDLIQFDINAKF
jgi:hypothetical protein